MRIRSGLLGIALLAIGVHTTPGIAQGAPDYEWSGAIPPGGELRLFTVRGDIQVASVPGSVVRIVGRTGHDQEADHRIHYELIEGNGIVVVCAVTEGQGHRSTCGKKGIRNVLSRSGPNAWSHFTVEIPEGADLRLSTGGGVLNISGVGGNIHARTGAGGVRIEGGWEVHATSGSGSVIVSRAVGPVTVRTGSGDITVRGASEGLNISTGSGSVDAEFLGTRKTEDLRVHTGGGGVTLRLPAHFAGEVDAQSSSGGLHSDFPLTVRGPIEGRRIRGTIGQGGATVRITTGSGTISLQRSGGSGED